MGALVGIIVGVSVGTVVGVMVGALLGLLQEQGHITMNRHPQILASISDQLRLTRLSALQLHWV